MVRRNLRLLSTKKAVSILLVCTMLAYEIIQHNYIFLRNLSIQFVSRGRNESDYRQKTNCFDIIGAETTHQSENDMEFGFDYDRVLTFPLDQQRPPLFPYVSGDFFRAIADHIIEFNRTETINETTLPNGALIFVKADALSMFAPFRATMKSKYFLITHNSDSSVPTVEFRDLLDDANLLAWFGQNIDMTHPKLFPIPIGFDNGNPDAGSTILNKISKKFFFIFLFNQKHVPYGFTLKTPSKRSIKVGAKQIKNS
jgi:hypothetical protein